MSSLLLHPETWDLMVDANGNIAIAGLPYSAAQDVACECKLWLGEARYNTNAGIPYETFLGELPTPARVIQAYTKAARGVPYVDSATVVTQFINRKLTGQIQFTIDEEKYAINL